MTRIHLPTITAFIWTNRGPNSQPRTQPRHVMHHAEFAQLVLSARWRRTPPRVQGHLRQSSRTNVRSRTRCPANWDLNRSLESEPGRVERWRGGVGFGVIPCLGFPVCVSIAACRAPFPPPAHQTGRADFPHPAFGQGVHVFAHGKFRVRTLNRTRPSSWCRC